MDDRNDAVQNMMTDEIDVRWQNFHFIAHNIPRKKLIYMYNDI
jgi:hypothetical protein